MTQTDDAAHHGLNVSDMEIASSLYRDALGLTLPNETVNRTVPRTTAASRTSVSE